MSDADPKIVLHRYLQRGRDALVWKLEGVSEYDARRPMTPTATNLLGVLKHVASVEAGYFGECFGRPFPEPLPWYDEGAERNADMWATPDESRDDIVGMYRRVWAHSDATIEQLPLDATAEVPWWPEGRRNPTLHWLLVHMVAENERHAGHCDILRELIDGATGIRPGNSPMVPGADEQWWRDYRARVEAAAQEAASRGPR
jgi:hypothetical protein